MQTYNLGTLVAKCVFPGVMMPDLCAHLTSISDFLLELVERDIINPDERIKLRVLYHKFNEQIELFYVLVPDKTDEKYLQTLKAARETQKHIKNFISNENSLTDLIPFLEIFVRAVINLLEPYIGIDNVKAEAGLDD